MVTAPIRRVNINSRAHSRGYLLDSHGVMTRAMCAMPVGCRTAPSDNHKSAYHLMPPACHPRVTRAVQSPGSGISEDFSIYTQFPRQLLEDSAKTLAAYGMKGGRDVLTVQDNSV